MSGINGPSYSIVLENNLSCIAAGETVMLACHPVKYGIRITIPTEGEPSMRLILDCSACDLQSLKKSANSIGDFAVVAQMTAAAMSLDASEDAPEYVLHGKLIDARYLGEYAIDTFLASQPDQKSPSK